MREYNTLHLYIDQVVCVAINNLQNLRKLMIQIVISLVVATIISSVVENGRFWEFIQQELLVINYDASIISHNLIITFK